MRARWMVAGAALAALVVNASVASAQPKKAVKAAAAAPAKAKAEESGAVLVFTGARVHTGTGDVLEGATVVVAGGKIREVGKGIAAPAGAEVIAADKMEITPGFVDPLTSIGLVEVDLEHDTHDDHRGDSNDAIRAGFRAVDGFNPASTVIPITRAEGVTSAGVIPQGGLISGQSLWADLDGAAAGEAIAAAPLALHVHLDADAPGRSAGRATAILRVREAFDDARAFVKNRAAWERNQTRAFAPSRLDLEALAGALDGKLPVVFHVDRAADIVAALGVAKEFNLKPVIAGGAEAWKVAPALAAAKAPVIVVPFAQPRSFESLGAREDNAARLFAAGVPVAISTGETHHARKLRQEAGNAVRSGLPHEAAIVALTRAPAEALGLGARYGTIAPGKVANLVVWSGDPLELGTQATTVVIRGKKVSLQNRQTALLAKYRRSPR